MAANRTDHRAKRPEHRSAQTKILTPDAPIVQDSKINYLKNINNFFKLV
jgi:hypothetical protein